MKPKLTLKIIDQAIEDWSKPCKNGYYNFTSLGFCSYFNSNCTHYHKKWWIKYATNPDGFFHFFGTGEFEKGRAERLAALHSMRRDFLANPFKCGIMLYVKTILNRIIS